MADIYKGELQDNLGNTVYPHTESDVVFCTDGATVQEKLTKYEDSLGTVTGKTDSLEVDDSNILATSKAVKQLSESLGNLVNFSTEEKLIGTWIDGKPLYTKTIQFTPTSNGYSAVNFSHGISNVETIYIDSQNSFEAAGTSTVPIKLTFGITDAGAIKTEYLFEIMSVDSTKVSYRMAPSAGITSVVLTLRYTKTTD